MRLLIILALLIGFLMVHMVKLMRLYLIMLDRQISIDRFVPAYLRTTLVNMIVPFKLGEIYRVVVFWKLSDGFKTGFFSVLMDRFFDTLAIVLILLPYQLLISRSVTLPVILLSVFLIVIVFAYVIFPSSYGFLNKYIITTKTSNRSMMVLRVLEQINEWYKYVEQLVTGRYGLLMLLSIVAWMFEILVLAGFAKLIGRTFKVGDFGEYIESIISGSTYHLKYQYMLVSIIVILVATIVSTIYYCVIAKRKHS